MPLVSVIIPAYDRSQMLEEAVRSVTAQDFPDWECVVVDDGSTEDISFVEKIDPRVRLMRQPNSRLPIARNNGILNSTGKYIALLDSDDVWLPGKLASQVEMMGRSPDMGFCYVAHGIITPDGERRMGPPEPQSRDGYTDMLRRGCPLPSTVMIRRACLGQVGVFDPMMPFSEDHDLLLRIAFKYPMGYVPSCQALYRIHKGNSSRNYMVSYATLLNLAQKHKIAALARGDREAARAAAQMPKFWRGILGTQAFDLAREAFRDHDVAGLAKHLIRAVRWCPGFVGRSVVGYLAGRRDLPGPSPEARRGGA